MEVDPPKGGAYANGPPELGPLALLRRAFGAAVAAADPATLLPPHLPAPPAQAGAPAGRLVVVGAGKAAAPMAAAVCAHYAARAPGATVVGAVVTPYGHGAAAQGPGAAAQPVGAGPPVQAPVAGCPVRILEAGHPVPDAAGVAATREIVRLVRSAREEDLLLVLLSGGGSALLSAPAHVTLAEKAALTRRLLAGGAPIHDINAVRKHLSAVKGGRLAALARAPSLTLAVSDVTGHDPATLAATIASGPTAPDPTTYADALAVMERYAPDLARVKAALARGAAGELPETPKPGDPRLAGARFRLVGNAGASLSAARSVLEAYGCEVVALGADVTGEAREVGREHAQVALGLLAQRADEARPLALVSGGEVTVTLRTAPDASSGRAPQGGAGRGGPNGEYALGFASALLGAGSGAARGDRWRVALLAADSDGIDGGGAAGDRSGRDGAAAGALLGPAELRRLNPELIDDALARHDSHGLLARVGGLLVTGPTRTNVNDVRLVVLQPTG